MKICYTTAQIPYGRGEEFILEEMLEIKQQGIDLLIIPRNPPREIFHKESEKILENAIGLPLIDFKILKVFLTTLFTEVSIWNILGIIIWHSRKPLVLIKNLAVFPKGVFISKIIKKRNIEHIHAHWGSTTATMAYVVSRITKIPWSFTLHRWDIKEDNMLKEKVKLAKFARCISEHGKNELFEIIGTEFKEKIQVIHMGVKIPSGVCEFQKDKKNFIITTPANLLEVKGHKYLIDACLILVYQGIKNFQCIFYGVGPLKTELENLVKEEKLTDYIKIPGVIPHEKLIGIYKNEKVNIVILPSINTKNGKHEGIPVALMEAMAHSIPVISTNTGGIPELLSGKAGVIVEEKNSQQLAVAIKKFIKNRDFREKIGRQGYERVFKKFNIRKNTEKLLELFKYYS